jgi:hypothetical protein
MQSHRFFQVYSRESYQGEERRCTPRIYYPIPLRIRIKQTSGEHLEFRTFANDLSTGGFSAHTAMECHAGQKLFFLMRFSLQKGIHAQAPLVAAQGIVLRSEKRFDGSYVFASTVGRRRFI